MLAIWLKTGKPDVAMTANGMLAGLVGITAGTAAVSNVGALIIGAVAGVLVVFAVLFFDRHQDRRPGRRHLGPRRVRRVRHHLRRPVRHRGHRLLAAGPLLRRRRRPARVSQVIGVVAVGVFVAVTAGILFAVIKATIGLRVSEEEELAGLDVLEHGAPGYGPDVTPSMMPRPVGSFTRVAGAAV